MAKKSKKAKLPKRIGGIKLSKSLRRGPLAEMLASPVGQNVVGEIIYHAGAAFVDARTDGSFKRSAAQASRRTARAGMSAAHAGYDGAGLFMGAFREGADAFIAALKRRRAEVRRLADSGNSHDVPDVEGTRGASELREEERGLRH